MCNPGPMTVLQLHTISVQNIMVNYHKYKCNTLYAGELDAIQKTKMTISNGIPFKNNNKLITTIRTGT